ncbi:MAG: OmpA family protein [Desulfobacterales bacterium]
MKFTSISLIIAAIVVAGCWGLKPAICAENGLEKERITIANQKIDLLRTVDNFVVLLDSAALAAVPDPDSGLTQLHGVRAALAAGIGQLPELNWRAGLFTYSPIGGHAPLAQTEFAIPGAAMQPFHQAALVAGIKTLTAGTGRPGLVQHALLRLETILTGLSGRTMAIIFSDGAHRSGAVGQDPIAQARALVERYNVSFTLIRTAKTAPQQKLLKSIAALAPKSRCIDLAHLAQHPIQLSGALFVLTDEILALSEHYPALAPIQIKDILFDFNQADLKPESIPHLDAAGRFLSAHPATEIILLGFTDNVGTPAYNQHLSGSRVRSVAEYLAEKFAISPTRILKFSYGEASPIVDNDSEACRRYNRRVVSLVVEK